MTKVEALVLERQHELALREIDLPLEVGAGMVRIAINTVGICGSDVHYYTHGRIGPFVVEAPMVLGHEAAGTVVEVGEGVSHLAVGDRVCMEPGIPDPDARATRLGMYNVDPAVRFWATPPVHGCLTPHVVHPANFTYKLPDNVSFAEAAMVEPFAVGMQAATKAKIAPGDFGCGDRGRPHWHHGGAGSAGRRLQPRSCGRHDGREAGHRGAVPRNYNGQRARDTARRGRARRDRRMGRWTWFSNAPARPRSTKRLSLCPGPADASSSSGCRSSRSGSIFQPQRPRNCGSSTFFDTPMSMTGRLR